LFICQFGFLFFWYDFALLYTKIMGVLLCRDKDLWRNNLNVRGVGVVLAGETQAYNWSKV
jgi:hypothetical protein